ncbi:MAG: helix-hairpin-helix domain-containing protein [Candidatus Poseidoniaceae archaeon]|nr:helix-hairpin-helix domain-containing protein [Candidatus Poseidoniaceae archaeon]
MGGHLRSIGEEMAAKPKKDPLASLMALPGIGKATAKKLHDSGIKSAAAIGKAGVKGLNNAGISPATAKKILAAVPKKKAASKAAAKKVASKAKSTVKKAAKKTKSKAKKTTAAAKKAASKATAAGKKVAEKVITEADGSKRVKSSKSKDGRKGSTLKVPRSVKDMPWFRKK